MGEGEGRRNQASNLRQFLAAFSASMIALSAGTVLAWSSPALPLLTSGSEQPQLTSDQAAWVGSLLTVGAFLGCPPAGRLADLLGRKKLLLLLAIPMCVGWSLLLFSGSAWGFYLARMLLGFTVGVMSVACPNYINDIATPNIRGALGALFQLQLTVGVLAMYIIGLMGTVFGMSVVCSILPFVFLGCFIWMPESPSYLVASGRTEDANKALQWLRGSRYDVQQELNDLQRGMEEKGSGEAGFAELFKTTASRRATCLALGVMFVQQACGVNAIVFYAQDIFQMSGGSISPHLSCIVTASLTVIATASASLLLDVAGRRSLLIFSAVVMSLSLIALGGFSAYQLEGFAWVPIVSVGVYCVAFSLGFGPIPWIIMAELFPARLKASASALCAAFSWGLAFLITKYFQDLVTWWGIAPAFWFFAGFCGMGAVFVFVSLPETKGKTTEDILLMLGDVPRGRDTETSGQPKDDLQAC